MTNQQIMSIAMRQSAIDLNADISDFTKEENVFVKSVDSWLVSGIWIARFKRRTALYVYAAVITS